MEYLRFTAVSIAVGVFLVLTWGCWELAGETVNAPAKPDALPRHWYRIAGWVFLVIALALVRLA